MSGRLSVPHLLGIEGLSRDDALLILETARSFREVNSRQLKKVPALRGRLVALLFFENSTRTRLSFELAAKRLSADTLNFSASTSSLSKGETLLDTARNIEAMGPDLVVVRHDASGAPWMLSRVMCGAIANAGDASMSTPPKHFSMPSRCCSVGAALRQRVSRERPSASSAISRARAWPAATCSSCHCLGPRFASSDRRR
jgi:aspartate carbamoyltransferase catalytic subunit